MSCSSVFSSEVTVISHFFVIFFEFFLADPTFCCIFEIFPILFCENHNVIFFYFLDFFEFLSFWSFFGVFLSLFLNFYACLRIIFWTCFWGPSSVLNEPKLSLCPYSNKQPAKNRIFHTITIWFNRPKF